MAGHKETELGHAARKKIQTYLQENGRFHGTTRRFAFADGVFAISGADGIQLACDLFEIDLEAGGLLDRFNAMIHNHGYVQALQRTADVCAEGHLWMTLVGIHARSYSQKGSAPRHQHPHPRHLEVWVYELSRTGGLKEDSPCANCKQWVRAEFQRLNGT